MLDKLILFSYFGAGDLFESREFVKEIMEIIPANEYYYAHGKNPRVFADIPNLQYTTVTDEMQPTSPYNKSGNSLFINTWIGRDSKYVLPQIGCVIDKNYEMFNDILTSLEYRKLSKPFIEYIPQVDYKYFYIKNINKFLSENTKRNILICNGIVQSCQAENFDFTPIINSIANEFQEYNFIITQPIEINCNNIYQTNLITNTPDGFDLNEISYLAKFCDVIIGRKSGPFVFAHSKDVWYDGTKKSLSFTYAKHSSHFVQQDNLPLRKYWSPNTDYDGILGEIRKVLTI